jgi:hypothetical protein
MFCADQNDSERQSKKGLSIRQREANRTDQHHQPPERQANGKATATGLDKGDEIPFTSISIHQNDSKQNRHFV